MKKFLSLLVILTMACRGQAQVKIGVARECITPDRPVWLSGYAARKKLSEGKLQDLWVKALVIEGKKNSRLIMITTDIIGLTKEISEDVTGSIIDKYGLERSQIFINSSHTHSAPVIWPGLSLMYSLSDSNIIALTEYGNKLRTSTKKAVDSAMANLAEGAISYGEGSAGFAINRRQRAGDAVKIGVNKEGPVDHSVPVLKFTSKNGNIVAVLFGYACHNTTLSGYDISGDYAGYAQDEIERMIPGAIAMFIEGCGADQNPEPRNTVEMAAKHGNELAAAVMKTLEGSLLPLKMPVRTVYSNITLEFNDFDPVRFYKELQDPDQYRRKRAEFLLEAYDRGYELDKLNYPVQCIRFGKDFVLIALSGEVVVDYSINLKNLYPGKNLFVAGYSSFVPCYIPSVRILREGGYEADNSMIYYGLPGPFKENVEEKIINTVRKNLKKISVN